MSQHAQIISLLTPGCRAKVEALESSDVSDSVRDTLETFSTGQTLALEFFPSLVGYVFRTKRLLLWFSSKTR